ncbi:MAG: hypothetical protein IJH07_04675 [Ruminococcus sp.]|nr:hypothetical protein [Ruminococcus sp.]
MKRIFALVLAAAMIGALLCACGGGKTGSTVKTTVSSKYDDGYAASYASSTSKDENGDTVYEFSNDQYESYLQNHKNTLGGDIQSDIASQHDEAYGEFAYISEEKQAVIIGVHTEQYDEETAKTESASAAEYGFKYFQNLETPVSSIKVIYCDANDQNTVFGTFEYTAE